MNKELLEFLIAFLGTTLNLDKDAVAALLNADGSPKPEALKTLTEKDAARVAGINAKGKEQFDNGYKKAEKEILTKMEKELKEKYKLTASDKQGLELIEEIVETTKPAPGKTKEITDDDVMKHPKYKELQLKAEADLKKTKEELEGKLTETQTAQKKRETFEKVKTQALAQLDSMHPIFSSDPVKAANQKAIFLRELESFEYDVKEDGSITVLKDNKIYKNAHENIVSFKDLAKEIADKYYDYKKAEDRGAPPPPGDGGAGSGAKVDVKKPTSRKEYDDQVMALRSNKLLADKDKETALIELDKLNDSARLEYEPK